MNSIFELRFLFQSKISQLMKKKLQVEKSELEIYNNIRFFNS